jgi:hypothetical protein
MKNVYYLQMDQRKISGELLKRAIKKLNKKCKRGISYIRIKAHYDIRRGIPLVCFIATEK